MKVTSALSVLPPLMEFIGGIAFVTALWYGSEAIAAERLTTGEFVAFITALFMMYGPAKKLSRVNADLQQARAAGERIFEILDTHSEVREAPDAVIAAAVCPIRRVQERAVSPTPAPKAARRLRGGRRFTVRAGQTLAIVGRSGAGKTTLVNLIPRFYDVTGGDHHHRRPQRARRDAGVAAVADRHGDAGDGALRRHDRRQHRLRPSGRDPDEIEAAARAAHAHEFIVTLDRGYDTLIGERGQRLSGGQRQRLAIARALLRDSPILILDEATSSLDAESEMLVQEALANLMLNRTSFVIAHRLSTVRRADAIVVLERGLVVETGTHDELMARGGAYAKLYELQLRDDSGPEAV